MSRQRRIAGRALLVAFSSLVTLGAAEGLYRWRQAESGVPDPGDDSWYERYRRFNEAIYQRSEDPELVYQPRPASSFEMEYGLAGFNAASLRDDRETSPMPSEGRTRVAVLGDSLVWGEFLPLELTIPRRAEEALGEGFEVLNAGVSGYATTEEARWYEVLLRPLHPRVVVLVYCMNDMMIMSGPFERFARGADRAAKDEQDAFFERMAPVRRETLDDVISRRERDATFRLLARALGVWERYRFEDHYVDEYLIVSEDEARRERVRAAISRLGSAILADGAIPVLVISPVLEGWEHYRWSALHELVRTAGEAAGFVVHDPLEAMRAEHDASVIRAGVDNLHYGETGSRVFGAVIADAVREALR